MGAQQCQHTWEEEEEGHGEGLCSWGGGTSSVRAAAAVCLIDLRAPPGATSGVHQGHQQAKDTHTKHNNHVPRTQQGHDHARTARKQRTPSTHTSTTKHNTKHTTKHAQRMTNDESHHGGDNSLTGSSSLTDNFHPHPLAECFWEPRREGAAVGFRQWVLGSGCVWGGRAASGGGGGPGLRVGAGRLRSGCGEWGNTAAACWAAAGGGRWRQRCVGLGGGHRCYAASERMRVKGWWVGLGWGAAGGTAAVGGLG